MDQQERNNNSYKKVSVILFQREESWGPPAHKRRFCVVQQKESRDVCKILFKEVKILPNKQIALSGL